MTLALVILLNLVVCLAGCLLCVCRLTKMKFGETKDSIRHQYAIWFAVLFISAISFVFGIPPDPWRLVTDTVILVFLAIGIPAWRHGPPAYARKSP